ncbi:MAG TPA: serine endopeptidase [Limnobacter sp.]|nr:serine endopeptidase [Limnobacter sp.]
MSKSLRLSEKWFRRGLWLVAFVFGSFLIGLGGTVVQDLPKVESVQTLESFMNPDQLAMVQQEIAQVQVIQREASEKLEQLQLQHKAAQAETATEQQKFDAWVTTREATNLSAQDEELVARTRKLENLQSLERQALQEVEQQQQRVLDARQGEAKAQRKMQDMQEQARASFEPARKSQELRVFGYRLALTLPLLLLAVWLYKNKRQSTYWPFVWGYIYFSVFVFFVELVPYLPSYGGYVRSVVGIGLTVVIGRQVILALNRYLEQQRLAEAQPENQRRETLEYDTALSRLAKGVCPGCERAVDLKDSNIDFCPHCGIGLYNRCPACTTRKSTFSKYCHSCGTSAIEPAIGQSPGQ